MTGPFEINEEVVFSFYNLIAKNGKQPSPGVTDVQLKSFIAPLTLIVAGADRFIL